MCASAPAGTGSTPLAAVNSEKSMTCLLFFISVGGIVPKFAATKVTIYIKTNAKEASRAIFDEKLSLKLGQPAALALERGADRYGLR
jgi:hypothetical protein